MCLISKKAMKVYQDLELWSSVDDGTTYTTSNAYMLHVLALYVIVTVLCYTWKQLNLSSADNHCKLSGPRSEPKECRSWSGSKLFDTLIVFLKDLFYFLFLNSVDPDQQGFYWCQPIIIYTLSSIWTPLKLM